MFNKSLIVLDQHNADQIWFESFLRSKSVVKKYFGKINLIRLSRVQEEYYRKVDLCFSVSKIDKEYTTKVVTKKSFIEVAPNGVDLNYFKSTRVNKKNNEIIFCGSMEVLMNQNAVLYFCKYIYPKIKKQIPDAKFNVVGKYPPVRIKRLHGSKKYFCNWNRI